MTSHASFSLWARQDNLSAKRIQSLILFCFCRKEAKNQRGTRRCCCDVDALKERVMTSLCDEDVSLVDYRSEWCHGDDCVACDMTSHHLSQSNADTSSSQGLPLPLPRTRTSLPLLSTSLRMTGSKWVCGRFVRIRSNKRELLCEKTDCWRTNNTHKQPPNTSPIKTRHPCSVEHLPHVT